MPRGGATAEPRDAEIAASNFADNRGGPKSICDDAEAVYGLLRLWRAAETTWSERSAAWAKDQYQRQGQWQSATLGRTPRRPIVADCTMELPLATSPPFPG